MRSVQSVYAFSSPRAKGFLVGEIHILVDEDDKALVDTLVSSSDGVLVEGVSDIPSRLCEFSQQNPYYLKKKPEIDLIRQEYVPKIAPYFLNRALPEQRAEVERFLDCQNPIPIVRTIVNSLLVPAEDRTRYVQGMVDPKAKALQTSMMYAKSVALSCGKGVHEVETADDKVESLFWKPEDIRTAYQFLAFEHIDPSEQKRLRELFQKGGLDKKLVLERGSNDESTQKRDERFVAEISKLEGRPLVMLGAAHLPGVMAGLQANGYVFRQEYAG